MIADGDSRFKVAKTLNDSSVPAKSGGKWHPLTIGRMITNEAYIGKTYFGRTHRNGKGLEDVPQDQWINMPDTTPAIVSDELFKQANKALAVSKELHHGRPKNDYLLTGHVRCSICGNHMEEPALTISTVIITVEVLIQPRLERLYAKLVMSGRMRWKRWSGIRSRKSLSIQR